MPCGPLSCPSDTTPRHLTLLLLSLSLLTVRSHQGGAVCTTHHVITPHTPARACPPEYVCGAPTQVTGQRPVVQQAAHVNLQQRAAGACGAAVRVVAVRQHGAEQLLEDSEVGVQATALLQPGALS